MPIALGTAIILFIASGLTIGLLLLRRYLTPVSDPRVKLAPSGARPWQRTRADSLHGNTNMQGSPFGGQLMPPNHGFMPPDGNFAPPNPGFMPPNANFAPPNPGFMPPNESFAPPNRGFAPPTAGFAPNTSSFAPPGFMPDNGGFVPSTPNPGFVPPTPGPGFAPDNGGFAPYNGEPWSEKSRIDGW